MRNSFFLMTAVSILAVNALGGAPSARAEETAAVTSAEASVLNEDFHAPRRFELLGGVSFGRSSLSDPTVSGMSGSQLGLMLVGSLYHDSFVGDLGVGWGRNTMSGSYLNAIPATVSTQTGLLEVSPRYRIGERFQLGPVVQAAYGARSDFSVTTGTNGNLVTLTGGLKAVYELPAFDRHVRLTARGMTDLNVAGSNLLLLLAGVEFPLYGAKLGGIRPLDAPVVAKNDQVVVALPMRLVHFESNSARLDEASLKFVHNLGRLLAESGLTWISVGVEGHTDQWGTEDYNQDLSERRARSVSRALARGGVDSGRLTEAGFGKTRPLLQGRSKQASARNRRVELSFRGVSDPARLIELLKSLE